jgi:DNA-binding NarL/FixJ family response regulator
MTSGAGNAGTLMSSPPQQPRVVSRIDYIDRRDERGRRDRSAILAGDLRLERNKSLILQAIDWLEVTEVAVIRALQQGKPNKVIAYELNMCESTVKVHVRNLMKKMKAKNRTDLAMKAQIPIAASVSMAT